MSPGALILIAAVAQNVVLVHFLGLWPYPVLLSSVRRSALFSIAVTGALVWVSLLYASLFRFVLQPLGAEYLATFSLLVVLAASYIVWIKIALVVHPFAGKAIRWAFPLIFLNATVFVVPMALAHAPVHLIYVPLVAFAAGVGLFVAVVPVAAMYQHLSTTRLPRVLRGNVIILLGTAVFALAIQQLDSVLATVSYPLW